MPSIMDIPLHGLDKFLNNVKFNFKGGGGGGIFPRSCGTTGLISIILSLGSKHGHGVWTVKT